MNDQEKTISAYLAGELTGNRRRRVEQLIRDDPEWREMYERLSGDLEQFERDLQAQTTRWEVPDFYWNNFLPRLHDNLDARLHRRAWKRWSLILAPALSAAVVAVMFYTGLFGHHGIMPSDEMSWIDTIEPEETINHILTQHPVSKDALMNYFSISPEAFNEDPKVYSTEQAIHDDLELIDPESAIQGLSEPLQKVFIDELMQSKII